MSDKTGRLELALAIAREQGIEAADETLQGYGIEYVSCADREIAYVNLGETYERTICQEGDEFFISSWGDWYETVENKHCEEEGVIRCGWCSEFTPLSDTGDWHETICESCGHHVDGGD